ncbi:MAG: M20/M25/M40 family metallo-hydrolase [Anaerolineae bacterium]|nr:M20/M25/M40 family metallo-hydrolase [Anaerolineae bacterium]
MKLELKRTALSLFLFLFPLFLGALACTFTEPPTPTFLPPVTALPSATAGTPSDAAPSPTGTLTALPADTPTVTPTAIDAGIASYLVQVDSDRLLISVDTLQNFGTRFVNADPGSTTTGIGGARAWIIKQFEQIQEQARVNGVPFVIMSHPFTLEWRGLVTTQTNVLAYLPGSGDRVNQVIIIGAHYDSISEYGDAASPAPGADDNASGVAVMLECARIMAQRQHRTTIMFAAFSAEETGRQGSQAFLADVVEGENLDVRAVINLDIVGAQQLPDGSMIADRVRLFAAPPDASPSRHLARLVQFAAARYMPDFAVDVQPTADRAEHWGDHITFSDAGYAAVRLIEAAEVPDRTNSVHDTMERISAGYMARVTRVVLVTLLALADGPAPPASVVFDPENNSLSWVAAPDAAGHIIAVRRVDSLVYDRRVEIEAADRFAPPANDDIFGGMHYAAVAAVDADGRQGPFSAEVPINP